MKDQELARIKPSGPVVGAQAAMGRIALNRADGTQTVFASSKPPTMDAIERMVGGRAQKRMIQDSHGNKGEVYFDEDGFRRGRPINVNMTKHLENLWGKDWNQGRPVLGDVVVLTGKAMLG